MKLWKQEKLCHLNQAKYGNPRYTKFVEINLKTNSHPSVLSQFGMDFRNSLIP